MPVPEPSALGNSAPSFTSDVQSEVTITMTEDADGVLDDISEFSYTSPTAVDEEGDLIEIVFSGLEGLPFANVKHNSDDSFTLKLKRELIDGSGSYTLTVKLGDTLHPEHSSSTM